MGSISKSHGACPQWKMFTTVTLGIVLCIWIIGTSIYANHIQEMISYLQKQQNRIRVTCTRANGEISPEVTWDGRRNPSSLGTELFRDVGEDADGDNYRFGLNPQSDRRKKREAQDGDKAPNERSRSGKRRRRQKKSNDVAIHFKAKFNDDRYRREKAEGLPITAGTRRADGFVKLSDAIYNIWDKVNVPSNYGFDKWFDYNTHEAGGKVTIRKRGLYLIYAQVTFHADSDIKIFGIYVNDELMPLAECMSDMTSRQQRRPETSAGAANVTHLAKTKLSSRYGNTRENADKDATFDELLSSFPKNIPPVPYEKYFQCHTNIVTYLNTSDDVFIQIRSGETFISVKGYLTFWGLAKL